MSGFISSSAHAQPAVQPKAAAGSVDLGLVRDNAIRKGCERFVIQTMIERCVARCIFDIPQLSKTPPENIRRHVSQRFMKSVEEAGSFQRAYNNELRVVLESGKMLPEQGLDELAAAAAAYSDATSRRVPVAQSERRRLIERARSIASILRTFAMDDRVVAEQLHQYPVLVKQGIAAEATTLIDTDRQVLHAARLRAHGGAQAGGARHAGAPEKRAAAVKPASPPPRP